jgi:hypothetical protein
MDYFEIVQHPLDRFSSTGGMGDLDATGRDSADQIMTMIGDLRFAKDNIRGTCARYFLFIDILWFSRLCLSAHVNCAQLRNYLWAVEQAEAAELENSFAESQASFFLARCEDRQECALNSPLFARCEPICANNARTEGHTSAVVPYFERAPLMRIQGVDSMHVLNGVRGKKT